MFIYGLNEANKLSCYLMKHERTAFPHIATISICEPDAHMLINILFERNPPIKEKLGAFSSFEIMRRRTSVKVVTTV